MASGSVAAVATGISAQSIAVLIALAAAVCFAFANVLQQRVASRLPSAAAFDTCVLLRLARRPLWLVGFVAIIISISLQAAALGMGRLVVIEPVLASSLLVALALAAWADHLTMRPGEWAAAFATFAGLAAFLMASEPSGGRPTAGTLQLGLAAAGAFAVAALATVVAVRLSAVRRALVLGVGGGVAAGVTDALTKSVAFLAGTRQLGVFGDFQLYLLALVGLLAYTMQQNGYRAAGLAAFLPAFAVLDPAVGSLLGLTIYHERIGNDPVRVVIETVSVIAATWGVARLARSSAARTTAKPAQSAPSHGEAPVGQQRPVPLAVGVSAALPVVPVHSEAHPEVGRGG
ncbi:MAG TPA: DMT family transporter [Streptosporangiaceae bacterium]|nr:DMT family transporter [Streptosporangiaceae bacterium]